MNKQNNDDIDIKHDLTDRQKFSATMKSFDKEYEKPCYLCDHVCSYDDEIDCERLKRWYEMFGRTDLDEE